MGGASPREAPQPKRAGADWEELGWSLEEDHKPRLEDICRTRVLQIGVDVILHWQSIQPKMRYPIAIERVDR